MTDSPLLHPTKASSAPAGISAQDHFSNPRFIGVSVEEEEEEEEAPH